MSIEEVIQKMINEAVDVRLASLPVAPRPLLGAEEVGERLGGIDKQSVYRLVRERKLRPVWLSTTRFKIQEEEVERFIREGGVKPCSLVEAPRKLSAR